MKLLSIREEPRTGRVVLTFENGKTLKTTGAVLAESGVFAEGELSDREYGALLAHAGLASAKERAVRTAAASPVSERELIRRLVRKGETEDDARAAADWLKELGLLDDARTASELTASAVRKGYGRARIRAELREKNIPEALAAQALEELPPMDGAIDRYLRRAFGDSEPDENAVRRAAQALYRRGHSWADIREGLRRFRCEPELTDDMEDPE